MRRSCQALMCASLVVACNKPPVDNRSGAGGEQGGDAAVHTLTWDGYDGEGPEWNEAVYIFDGKPCGRGEEGIAKLKRLELERGSIVRIVVPWVIGPSSPPRFAPYSHSDLLSHWQEGGVILEIEEVEEQDPGDPKTRRYRIEGSSGGQFRGSSAHSSGDRILIYDKE